MADLGSRAADEARRWIGTPYRHQASRQGAGCDCLGLVRGVWRALYGADPGPTPAYSPDWSEPTGAERLLAAADATLARRIGPLQPGDVLLFRMRRSGPAKHLGVLSDAGALIHAHSKRGVVEAMLGAAWMARLAAAYSWPETPRARTQEMGTAWRP